MQQMRIFKVEIIVRESILDADELAMFYGLLAGDTVTVTDITPYHDNNQQDLPLAT